MFGVVRNWYSITHQLITWERPRYAENRSSGIQFGGVNIKNSTLSSRINLNVNLNAGIRLLANTSFSIDKYRGPAAADVTTAYGMAFNASP